MLPFVCICMLSAVPLVCDRDHSGMTEGILIASGKWFIINSMAFPWWRSAVCGLVMAYSIFALPFPDRTGDGPPLKRNVYFTGESQKDRKESVIVIRLFYVCSLVIKYTGGVVAVWYTYKFLLGYTTSPALLSLGMLSSIACFAGGITVFKKVVTRFIKYQQSKEEKRWFLAVGIMGLCEAFLDENDILPLIMISVISMFIICVITTGWDYDRSGVSDGLLMTYMQWTTLSLFNSKSAWQSVISGLTLSFVVASKVILSAYQCFNTFINLRLILF
ncbi:hypothetical protein MKW94_023463 [Papaver nudicaule]|uniref:Uncharacterized protein n=1 Tax=Papaver nudicaule TaxID=74823 RepID=A0AA41SCM4_PAPNU|nr:hypothetical protein [Papaver nudicaule]